MTAEPVAGLEMVTCAIGGMCCAKSTSLSVTFASALEIVAKTFMSKMFRLEIDFQARGYAKSPRQLVNVAGISASIPIAPVAPPTFAAGSGGLLPTEAIAVRISMRSAFAFFVM